MTCLSGHERTRTGQAIGGLRQQAGENLRPSGWNNVDALYALLLWQRLPPELHARISEIEREATNCLIFATGKRKDILPLWDAYCVFRSRGSVSGLPDSLPVGILMTAAGDCLTCFIPTEIDDFRARCYRCLVHAGRIIRTCRLPCTSERSIICVLLRFDAVREPLVLRCCWTRANSKRLCTGLGSPPRPGSTGHPIMLTGVTLTCLMCPDQKV